MENNFKYAFVLGHVPELSYVEVQKVLNARAVSFTELLYHPEVLVIETTEKLAVDQLQQQLGGTIKIAIIDLLSAEADLAPHLLDLATKIFKLRQQQNNGLTKFQFGFSFYAGVRFKDYAKIGLAIKKHLKNIADSAVRFIESKEKNLSSVIVSKENLLTKGADLVIIKTAVAPGQTSASYYLGSTITAQDWDSYSARDYGRPERDGRQGLLPPKLAQIMINLSQPPVGAVLLDPFCGSGTVLQEALLLGYQNLIGSDLSAPAVEQTRHNLEWLKTKYQTNISGVQLYQLDARLLSSKIKNSSVDVIVSEPYLGEQQKSKVLSQSPVQRSQSLAELEALYWQAFKEFYQVLKTNGRVVFIFPIIAGHHCEILDKIKTIGFVQENLSSIARGTVIYQRANQRVLREIAVFVKR